MKITRSWLATLLAGTKTATVHKYAKAISITDEARLSGFGNPMDEAAKQLARSIDQGVDDELFSVLNGVNIQPQVGQQHPVRRQCLPRACAVR